MNEFFTSTDGRRVVKALAGVLGILAIFLIFELVSVARSWSEPNPAANTISVNGTGTATSTPDIATFSFSVSADAAAVADAQSTVTTKTNAILASLKDLGIADKDIQASDYSVYPKYKYTTAVPCPSGIICQPGSNQVPDGYTVSESITVKVRKTDDAGAALKAAGDNGATNISGLSFTLDDPNAPANAAQLNAIDDAKSKAEALAKRLGVHLGHVVSFSDNGGSNPIYPMFKTMSAGTAADAAAPVLPTGENTVTSNVTVTYEIR